jgi:hypothetical protein
LTGTMTIEMAYSTKETDHGHDDEAQDRDS